MKKLLKLLFTLSATTTLPLSVIACQQESLDGTLKKIYDGETKFTINQILSEESITETITTKSLTIAKANELAKGIAETILTANNPITWFDQSLEVNQTCYNFNITNGTKDDSNSNISWDVKKDNQKFDINISYLVGKVNQNKNFDAKQRINMTFNIKAGTSSSDIILNKWITNFNGQTANPIEVNLTSQNITKPKNGTSWSDVEKKVITATYEAIAGKLTWDGAKEVTTYYIQNVDATITNDSLKIKINASLNDAKANSADFAIKFV
ncbi:MAG: hypothetical protein REH79_00615 [Spiroplasma sp.]|nr:hypothetical protein [Spiroplasma sp.]